MTIGNTDIKKVLYATKKPDSLTIMRAQFDSIQGPPLRSMLTEQDIAQLYTIIMDPKLSANLPSKHKAMNEYLKARGFYKFASGTNRIAYRYAYNNNIILKVAVDKTGLSDSLREYQNQEKLKPFVCKIFDVHPTGIAAVVERVTPITSHKTFALVMSDYYDIMTKFFIGRFVMEDIGEEYFMNWGLRDNFGLVLLDYPYLYELDDARLYCNERDRRYPGTICGGEIDYDIGFNRLVCKKCGREYPAKELARSIQERRITMVRTNVSNFNVRVMRGDKVVVDNGATSDVILPPSAPKVKKVYARHKVDINHTTYPKNKDGIQVNPYFHGVTREQLNVPRPIQKDILPPAAPPDPTVEKVTVKPYIPNRVTVPAQPPVAPEVKEEEIHTIPNEHMNLNPNTEEEQPVQNEYLSKEKLASMTTLLSPDDINRIFMNVIREAGSFEKVKSDIIRFLSVRVEMSLPEEQMMFNLLDALKPAFEKSKDSVLSEVAKIEEEHHHEHVEEQKTVSNDSYEEDGITFVKAPKAMELEDHEEENTRSEEPISATDVEEEKEYVDSLDAVDSLLDIKKEEEEAMVENVVVEKSHDELVEEFFANIKAVIEDYLKDYLERDPNPTFKAFRDDMHGLVDNDWPDYPFPEEMSIAEGHKWMDRYLRDNQFSKYFYEEDEESIKVEKIHRSKNYRDMGAF